MILGAGCGDGDPTGADRPGAPTGTSGDESPAGRLVGTWRHETLVEVPGDIQAWSTTWRFDSDGGCLQTVVTQSLAEGFPRTSERPCTFLARDFVVTVSFTGAGTLEFEYTFADFSTDRLVLDGLEYQRID